MHAVIRSGDDNDRTGRREQDNEANDMNNTPRSTAHPRTAVDDRNNAEVELRTDGALEAGTREAARDCPTGSADRAQRHPRCGLRWQRHTEGDATGAQAGLRTRRADRSPSRRDVRQWHQRAALEGLTVAGAVAEFAPIAACGTAFPFHPPRRNSRRTPAG